MFAPLPRPLPRRRPYRTPVTSSSGPKIGEPTTASMLCRLSCERIRRRSWKNVCFSDNTCRNTVSLNSRPPPQRGSLSSGAGRSGRHLPVLVRVEDDQPDVQPDHAHQGARRLVEELLRLAARERCSARIVSIQCVRTSGDGASPIATGWAAGTECADGLTGSRVRKPPAANSSVVSSGMSSVPRSCVAAMSPSVEATGLGRRHLRSGHRRGLGPRAGSRRERGRAERDRRLADGEAHGQRGLAHSPTLMTLPSPSSTAERWLKFCRRTRSAGSSST